MARRVGYSGSIELGGAAVVGIGNWALNIASDTPEATGLDSAGIKAFLAGLTSWDGTADGYWDTTETKFVGATPTLKVGSTVTFTGKLSAAAGNNYTGQCIIKGFSIKDDVTGLIGFTISFQGTGALTYATAG